MVVATALAQGDAVEEGVRIEVVASPELVAVEDVTQHLRVVLVGHP